MLDADDLEALAQDTRRGAGIRARRDIENGVSGLDEPAIDPLAGLDPERAIKRVLCPP